MMEFRNPKYNVFGGIDMEINHDAHGWIPFTADPNSGEPLQIQLYTSALATAAPSDEASSGLTALPPLTPRQLWLAAMTAGITKDYVIGQLANVSDAEEREWLRIELLEANSFVRSHPAVSLLATMIGMPDEQIDALWMWASTL